MYLLICTEDIHEGKSEMKEDGDPQRVGGKRAAWRNGKGVVGTRWGGPFLIIPFCTAPTPKAEIVFHIPQNKQLQSTRILENSQWNTHSDT